MARLTFTITLLSVLMAASVARADADLPEDDRIDVAALPAAVEGLALRSCLADSDEAAARSRWSAYRVPLRPGGAAFFIQCRFPASNDVHTVVLQRADGRARLGSFSGGEPDVFNAMWDARSQTIIDMSQSGAACAQIRRWKWTGQKFAMIRSEAIGCAE